MPRDSGGYYALGQTYRMAGKYDQAQEQLDTALSIKKDFSDAHFELGMVFAEQQEIGKAKDELDILNEAAPELVSELQSKILEKTPPRFLSAYAANINLSSKPGRLVSSFDASLATPLAMKTFTVSFVFDKTMDPASIQNTTNWSISRSNSMNTGGPYNWGIETPTTEVSIAPNPLCVTFRQDIATATVTFAIISELYG